MLFKKLPPRPRNRILAYIADPSFDAWRQVRDIPVSPGLSLFDVVEKIDRDYSWIDYSHPSSILVARASGFVAKRAQEMDEFDLFPLTQEDP